MSSAFICPWIVPQFCDPDGVPYAGGFLYSYIAGTSIPQATYTDETGATPNTNPIILDAAGRANIWLAAGSYKFILEDDLSNIIKTIDNVTASANGNSLGAQNIFTIADNQSSYQNITNMVFASASNQCAVVEYTILRSNGSTTKRREHGYLYCTYDSVNGWVLNRTTQGVDSLNAGSTSLAITAGGQIQYKSDSLGGTYRGQMTWQINSAFPAEGF